MRGSLNLAQTLAAVRAADCQVSHDGEGDLRLVKRVPTARVPGPVVEALKLHRGTLSSPCGFCEATVLMPCRVGEICARRDCPYRER